MSTHAAHPLSAFQIWFLAIRPKIMSAAIAPVVVGTGVAIHEDGFVWWIAALALITAILLQIASNLANDAIDAKKGTDTHERTGPMRLTASGYVTYRQMMNATYISLALAMVTGLPLIIYGGWIYVALGIAAMLSALAYTGGPFPISYLGLGEVFVFLFFGLVAVTGTAYLQTGELTALSLAASIPPGALIVAILIVNNYRDRPQDEVAGKRTVAVRIGARNTRIQFYLMLLATALSPLVFWALGWMNAWALITLLAWPMLWQLAQQIRTLHGPALNRTLGATSKTVLVHSLLLAAALILSN